MLTPGKKKTPKIAVPMSFRLIYSHCSWGGKEETLRKFCCQKYLNVAVKGMGFAFPLPLHKYQDISISILEAMHMPGTVNSHQ